MHITIIAKIGKFLNANNPNKLSYNNESNTLLFKI